ncbi:NAD-dependent epimerase/dehydratase family protein [Kineococcus radiotolerans]|uniref:NAD-dependent epimerase/dehydratase n=1 Tax=Kineococcus radiotolerans (strain ATCC BAA-149 / DSM 14245 / SRS30216) TaxID=266940 RepID=A6WA62_KINRD|nr:NAD-dependent epimerase/dehydratase family protein [Kineococcus radiotolerans]ABS03701.1 NAD-dependent epimerase/dehydratase [Kineococcus radiotolerans SRS30216 = ATCC BAA-149]
MSVLLTGATGHIGSAVLRSLIARSHDVVALVRSSAGAELVSGQGARAVVGDITDQVLLRDLMSRVDGVVHTASPGDATSAQVDTTVVDLAISTLGGTNIPYVHTGGVWIFGSGSDLVETDAPNPLPITAWRLSIEDRLRASAVRSTIIAPTVVYGYGRGIPNVLAGNENGGAGGEVRLVGDGRQHWATVHADDLADLYVLALEKAGSDDYFLGASGANPTVRELGEAAAHGRPVVEESIDATRERLGAMFADALLLDQQAFGRHAREDLGWTPTHPTLLEELASGGYQRLS